MQLVLYNQMRAHTETNFNKAEYANGRARVHRRRVYHENGPRAVSIAVKPVEPPEPNLLCPRQESTGSYVSPQSSIDVDAIMTGAAPPRLEAEKHKQQQQLRNEPKGTPPPPPLPKHPHVCFNHSRRVSLSCCW